MPCTAKKWETQRNDDMKSAGHGYDVDIVITTRELARMIKQAGIDILKLNDEEADSPLGPYTGAGTIFGVTGGVMEAAVRSAYFLVTKKEMPDVNFKPARGLEGVKEGEVDFGNGTKIRIAVAHQMGNIAVVLDKIRAARDAGQEPPYHFIEVMACEAVLQAAASRTAVQTKYANSVLRAFTLMMNSQNTAALIRIHA
jgi:NADH-quinone oxidoreductase subunit G